MLLKKSKKIDIKCFSSLDSVHGNILNIFLHVHSKCPKSKNRKSKSINLSTTLFLDFVFVEAYHLFLFSICSLSQSQKGHNFYSIFLHLVRKGKMSLEGFCISLFQEVPSLMARSFKDFPLKIIYSF